LRMVSGEYLELRRETRRKIFRGPEGCHADPRRRLAPYYLLAILRILLAIAPQSGYIHPDEYFQSLEIVTGTTSPNSLSNKLVVILGAPPFFTQNNSRLLTCVNAFCDCENFKFIFVYLIFVGFHTKSVLSSNNFVTFMFSSRLSLVRTSRTYTLHWTVLSKILS
jgi:hypothetical protein